MIYYVQMLVMLQVFTSHSTHWTSQTNILLIFNLFLYMFRVILTFLTDTPAIL